MPTRTVLAHEQAVANTETNSGLLWSWLKKINGHDPFGCDSDSD